MDFGKDTLEKKAKWWDPDGPDDPDKTGKKRNGGDYEKKKVVRFKFRPDREKMSQRMCISEHPFGTIKRALGAAYFLLIGKRKVSGEFALMATGYNIARVENMFTFDELMARVGA